jgi:hypothetical protein
VTVWYASLRSTQTCTPDGHLHRVTYTSCRIVTINSPDDEHMSARNMWRFGINIYEKKNCASSWSFTRILSLLFTPCEISDGRIGAGTDFSLSVSFHRYPIPIFYMKILPERQTSEVWVSGRCDWKMTITFLSFVHGSDQTIVRYCLCCAVIVLRNVC